MRQSQVAVEDFLRCRQSADRRRACGRFRAKRIEEIKNILVLAAKNSRTLRSLRALQLNKQARLLRRRDAKCIKRRAERFNLLLRVEGEFNALRFLLHALRHEATHFKAERHFTNGGDALFFQLGNLLIACGDQFFFRNAILACLGDGLGERINQSVHLLLKLRHWISGQALDRLLETDEAFHELLQLLNASERPRG